MGKVEVRQTPNTLAVGRVDFRENRFEAAIHQKGKDVIWESAIKCPCKLDGRGYLKTCVNCGGLGWVFINPLKTKMVIQSMNLSTKTTSWSIEKVGMASISTRGSDLVSDMDRITIDGSISKLSQVVYPKLYNSKIFAFTNYPITNIIDIFLFKDDGSKLIKLDKSKYEIDGNKVLFNKKLYTEGMAVTIRYTHPIQYFIIDIPREVRESPVNDAGGQFTAKLPLSAVGRRCHYVINPDNFTGASVVDNSYPTIPPKPYIVTDVAN